MGLKFTTLLFCFLVFFWPKGEAQNSQVKAKKITQFPFRQLNGGVVVLKAQLDPFPDTLYFILDTGSGGISLDSATAAKYALPLEESNRMVKGIGGSRKLNFYKNGMLRLPGLEVAGLDFHINDYELLSEVYGFHIDGIIGYAFLRRYIVEINYDLNLLSLYEPGLFNYPKRGRHLNTFFTTIPYTEQTIIDRREVKARLFFDIGAGLCVLLSEQFIRDCVFIDKKRKSVITQVEGIAGKINMRYTTLKKMKIGPYRFKNIPLHIHEDVVNVFNYPSVGGLIGNDLLRRFNQVINYPSQTIHLTPNSHFKEPFDYSYTGMNYYFINGKVVVADIHPGSPAERAGFQEGDILIGVDNHFSNDIQQYKTLLQNAGGKLKVLVLRKDQLVQLTLKVGNVLRR